MAYPHYTGDSVSWAGGGRLCKQFYGPPPEVVTLCGSTRFRQQFEETADQLTHAGKIVLTVHCFKEQHGDPFDEQVRAQLDELHKRKIDLSSCIFIINEAGYIGESTRSEILYADAHQLRLEWLHPELAADLRALQDYEDAGAGALRVTAEGLLPVQAVLAPGP